MPIAVSNPSEVNPNSLGVHEEELPLPSYVKGHALAMCCLEIIAPQIRATRRRVRDGARSLQLSYPHAPFDPATIGQILAANLAEELLTMMTRVMVLELNIARLEGRLSGETPAERFQDFVNQLRAPGGAAALIEDYPVLFEQIQKHLDRWAPFVLEFLRHLCGDWLEIRGMFLDDKPGVLSAVDRSAGDAHRHGRSVIIASFSGGGRIVYKPRSLRVDEHFRQLLARLNELGVQPPLRPLQTLDRGDYGWADFVHDEPCRTVGEVARFYQRQGSYLAILYALEASDFHCENLIAAGEHPMPIDLEALFHPRLRITNDGGADEAAGSALGYSVLRVGLLPMRYWGADGVDGIDLSALGSAAGQLTPEALPSWEGAGTDEMRLVRKRMEMPGARNCPSLNGREVHAFEYAEAVAKGFAATYRVLLGHREDLLPLLQRFAADEVRVIVRPTRVYGAFLRESFHPDLLRDAKDRELFFDRLPSAGENSSGAARLLQAERGDLLRGDIPLFTTCPASRDIRTSSGDHVRDSFEHSGMELVSRRFEQLSEKDLERQLWIVRASMATLGSHVREPARRERRVSRSERGAGPSRFLSAARRIGDRLEELALTGDDGVSWIGLVPVEDCEWRLSPLGPDLYDGLPGIILFLTYLHRVARDARYLSLAHGALRTLRRQVKEQQSLLGIGAFLGWGGVIYVLSHLDLLDEAERLAGSIPELAARDQHFDIIGGAAGCILALASLHRARPSAAAVKAARACGDRLLETSRQADEGIGWVSDELGSEPLTGFAHGNAGIAYALLVLAGLTGEPRYAMAAREAMRYERSRFSPAHGNWPDLRERKMSDFLIAWCHGAPGIGLSRLHSLRYMEEPALRREIASALQTTAAQGFGNNHTLCHGDFGNLELLLQAAETLREPRWRVQANEIAAGILDSAEESGWVCGNPSGLESPGLMTGLAGIGYELLRLARPKWVPPVLALAPPYCGSQRTRRRGAQ